MKWSTRFEILLGAVIYAGLLMEFSLLPAFAQEDDPPPERRVVIKVADKGYLWWMKNWSDGEEVCELLVSHPGIPTWEEVSAGCGTVIFNGWRDTPPCFEAADGEDTSDCEGVYLLFAGYLEGEYSVIEELPKPSVSISLEGCDRENLSYRCADTPILVFSAIEPLPDERIAGITIEVGDETYECQGAHCPVPLRTYQGLELEMTFWADSTYGDYTPTYTALARPVLLEMEDGSTPELWQVEVLSTQWVGPAAAACALTWGSFPPIEPTEAWLTTPEDPAELATDEPLDLLADRLLVSGLAEAPNCPFQGLTKDGTATTCGVESTREAVQVWQDRFDEQIFSAAQGKGLPAQMIKRIFAQESQFWPGRYPELDEYGLGGLHLEGTDTLLLWNISYYKQICPLVLSDESCAKRYHQLDFDTQEMLRGLLATLADFSCPECSGGFDLDVAEASVDLFADLLLANCAQAGELVRQVYRTAPGRAASYPDLWRLTLANYNAGSGCLYAALDDVHRQRLPLEWPLVKDALLELDGCSGAVRYVEGITRH